MARAHSGLGKFAPTTVITKRFVMFSARCTERAKVESPCVYALPLLNAIVRSNPSYAVPLKTVETYTQRDTLWTELVEKLHIRPKKYSIPHVVTICGLGGAGKSQLSLKYVEEHKERYNPILWIDATDEEAVRPCFQRCAAELELPYEKDEKHGSRLADMSAIQPVLR